MKFWHVFLPKKRRITIKHFKIFYIDFFKNLFKQGDDVTKTQGVYKEWKTVKSLRLGSIEERSKNIAGFKMTDYSDWRCILIFEDCREARYRRGVPQVGSARKESKWWLHLASSKVKRRDLVANLVACLNSWNRGTRSVPWKYL